MYVKQYLIDTNVIRYKVNIDANIKKHARFFWKKVITEIQNGEAVIYVPMRSKESWRYNPSALSYMEMKKN